MKGQATYEQTVMALGKIIVQPREKAVIRAREVFQVVAEELHQVGEKYRASAKESTKARMDFMRLMQEKKEDLARWQDTRQELEEAFRAKLRDQ